LGAKPLHGLGGKSAPPRGPPHLVQIDAASVVLAGKDGAIVAPGDVERDPAGRRLAGGPAHPRALDAMGDGVAHNLHERRLHGSENVGVKPDVAASRLEHDLLRQGPGGIARDAFEDGEQGSCSDQAQLLGSVAQLTQLAIDLIDRCAQPALDTADAASEIVGQPINRPSWMAFYTQL